MRGVLLACAAMALAQEPIRVTTRLIETNVVVRDSQGPVSDLKQESFTLFEDGKPRRIAVFRVSKVPTEAPKPLPPGLFANRTADVARQPRYKVLLIDTLNTNYADQAYTRTQIIKMLSHAEIREPLAIYSMGDRFSVLQEFTTDKARLLAGIQAFVPQGSIELSMAARGGAQESAPPPPVGPASPNAPQVRSMNGQGNQVTGGKRAVLGGMASGEWGSDSLYANEKRAGMTLRTFEELAKHLERAPGRKSIIWISSGFPIQLLIDHETLRWRALGNVAIYPVYAHGLGLSESNIDTMSWVADQTSGRAFYNRNDIGEAVKEATRDDDVTYTLGFYSDRDKPDGGFHTLNVKVEGKDLTVRSRPGYVDKEPDHGLEGDPTVLAQHVANDDFDVAEVGMAARITQLGSNFRVLMSVDVKDLHVVRDGARWKGSVMLASVSRAADGVALDRSTKRVALDMTDAEYQVRLKNGLTMSLTMPARAGAKRIRVAIVDQGGAAGSVLVIPK